MNLGWRNGSPFETIDCSCRGSEFGSQYPHQVTHLFLELQLQKANTSLTFGTKDTDPHTYVSINYKIFKVKDML